MLPIAEQERLRVQANKMISAQLGFGLAEVYAWESLASHSTRLDCSVAEGQCIFVGEGKGWSRWWRGEDPGLGLQGQYCLGVYAGLGGESSVTESELGLPWVILFCVQDRFGSVCPRAWNGVWWRESVWVLDGWTCGLEVWNQHVAKGSLCTQD